jgi:hypothetical protein
MGENGFYNYVRANFLPDVTFEEACDLRAKFFAGYPDLVCWQDEYARACREQAYTLLRPRTDTFAQVVVCVESQQASSCW